MTSSPRSTIMWYGTSGPCYVNIFPFEVLKGSFLSTSHKRTSVWPLNKLYLLFILLQLIVFKGSLSGLWQFLPIESPLKMMENALYFTSKAFFVFKVFKFLSWLSGHVAKHLDWKDKVNFKFYEVTAWLTNNNCPASRQVKAIRQWNLVNW